MGKKTEIDTVINIMTRSASKAETSVKGNNIQRPNYCMILIQHYTLQNTVFTLVKGKHITIEK